MQEHKYSLISLCIFYILASGISTIIVNASGQTNTLQVDNDDIYSSPDESSQTVLSLENETSVATVIEQVQVTNLTTLNQTNRPEEFPSSVRIDSMPEEEVHTAEKNTSEAIKTNTEVLSIPPPTTPSLNTSFVFTPPTNTSSIFNSNITNNSTIDYSGINSSGISHNTSSLDRTISGFDGLGSNDTCMGCLPPDVHIAVGRNHLVQIINGAIGFWNKNETKITAIPLNELFNVSSESVTSDPNILYDNVTDRWLASILDADSRSVRLAFSTTPDPLGIWNITIFPFTGVNSVNGCPDRPLMGISDDKLVISSNVFRIDSSGRCPYDGGPMDYMTAQFVVIDKIDLVSGGIIQTISFEGNRSSLFPVKSFTPRSELLLVSVGYDDATRLSVITIEGDAPDDLIVKPSLPSLPKIRTTDEPPNAVQPNTTVLLDTGDARVLDAVASSNEVWITFNDACTPPGDTLTRSCFSLLHLDLDDGSVVQFPVGFKESYYFYPALAVDTEKNLFVIFGYSSSTIFPSLAIMKMSVGSELNTITGSFLLLRRGETANEEEPLIHLPECDRENPCARYGDYFSATIDPLDPSTIWVAGEYYKEPTYSTYIGRIS